MAATNIEFFIRVEKNLFLSQMDTDNCWIKAGVFLLTGLWDRAVTPGQSCALSATGRLPRKRLDVWTALPVYRNSGHRHMIFHLRSSLQSVLIRVEKAFFASTLSNLFYNSDAFLQHPG